MHSEGIPHLGEVLLFLALAGVLIPLLQRLRFGTIPGFLLAGAIVGPSGLGRFGDDVPLLGLLTIEGGPGVDALAETGVMFLMFSVGLELSIARLWAMRRWVFGAGALQVVLSAAVIGVLAAALGQPAPAALVVGLVLAFSSTAVVMQLLAEKRELGSPTGRAVFSVLLFQDLAVVPVLILVGTLGGPLGEDVLLSVTIALSKAVAAIVAIYLLGGRVMRPLFRWLAATRQADTFMALTLLATLGIASLTWLAGLSMALGAFLAGLLLAETEFRHEVEIAIEPFRGLLMSLFFLSVGMGLDLVMLQREPLWVAAGLVVLFAAKALVAGAVLRTFALPRGASLEAGMLLGQGGEFAFVVVGAAFALELLPAAVANYLMLLIGLSLFVTPLLAAPARSLARRLDSAPTAVAMLAPPPAELEAHVVIAGFGRVGQLLANLLDRQGITWVAVDRDQATAARFHAQGLPVFVGDAGRIELLRLLRPEAARAVVLTMDQPPAALRALAELRSHWPAVPVLARARDEVHAAELHRAGASEVVPEALEAALHLGGRLLERTGVPVNVITAIVELERRRRLVASVPEHAQDGR
jgi:CPA2 family monovalent cation:H+ antiporter-2